MNRFLIIISLVLLLASCAQRSEKVPEGILSQDQMVDIIKDIQLLEAVHKDIGVFGMEKQRMRDTSYLIVFNKYGVKAAEFDSAYSYYTKRPIAFEQIMEKVEYQLSKEE